jgi:hypothetical protein
MLDGYLVVLLILSPQNSRLPDLDTAWRLESMVKSSFFEGCSDGVGMLVWVSWLARALLELWI